RKRMWKSIPAFSAPSTKPAVDLSLSGASGSSCQIRGIRKMARPTPRRIAAGMTHFAKDRWDMAWASSAEQVLGQGEHGLSVLHNGLVVHAVRLTLRWPGLPTGLLSA